MNTKSRIAWTTLFLLPLLFLLIFIFAGKKKLGYVDPEKKSQQVDFKKFSDKWAGLPFVRISRTLEFEKIIESIEINPSASLTVDQKTGLQRAIFNWIMAFYEGTYDSFREFRVPVSEFTLQESVRNGFSEDLRKAKKPVPLDGEGMLKAYWDSYCVDVWTNCWTEFNITHASIDVLHTNAVVSKLIEYVKTKENAGISQTGPMLKFRDEPSRIIETVGSITYATVCIVPKGDGATFPVYCRFYWLDTKSKWLPDDMATAYIGPERKRLLF